MVKRANSKLWCLKRLKKLGAKTEDLIDVYIKQIRSILEFATPVWHPGLNGEQRLSVERIQKCAFNIILGEKYSSYRSALCELKMETLFYRRDKLCKKFAKKAQKHSKFSKWFKPSCETRLTRLKKDTFCEVIARTVRFGRSPISFLTNLLNNQGT